MKEEEELKIEEKGGKEGKGNTNIKHMSSYISSLVDKGERVRVFGNWRREKRIKGKGEILLFLLLKDIGREIYGYCTCCMIGDYFQIEE